MTLLSRVLNLHGNESSNSRSHQQVRDPLRSSPKPVASIPTEPSKPIISDYHITITLESPPIVLYGNPHESTGSIISGILTLTTIKPVELKQVTLSLVQTMKYTKPFTVQNSSTSSTAATSTMCYECNSLITTNELARWDVLTSTVTFPQGEHQYPFSHLLPGSLPPTSKLGSTTGSNTTYIKYELIASAKSKTNRDSVKLSMPITISRSILRGPERSSLRIFPPTSVTASVLIPNVIYPKSTVPIEIKLDNLVSRQRRWRMKKLNWRIKEHTKVKARTCEQHESELQELTELYRSTDLGNNSKLTNNHGVAGVYTNMSLLACPNNQSSRSNHRRSRSGHHHNHVPEIELVPTTTNGSIEAHHSYLEDFPDNTVPEDSTDIPPPPATAVPDQEKHIYLEEIRTVANGEIRQGWKSDFSGRGVVELVAHINLSQITSGISSTITKISSNDSTSTASESLMYANMACDIDDPTLGVHVNHTLILEVVVAEEIMTIAKEAPSISRTRGSTISKTPLTTSISAPASSSSFSRSRSASTPTRTTTTPPISTSSSSSSMPTGAARVLRMQFKLPITERSGLGIAWDDEVPPTYEDIRTFSPPNYDTSTPSLNTITTPSYVSIDGIGGDLPEDLPEEFTL
ncbi:Protein LDB19 [Spathaspora sp. JA1]|nr:Protein LDB19 [Spathaspora sp. JA1]